MQRFVVFFSITLNTSTILQVIWYCNIWLKHRYVLQNWQHVWGGTNTTVICFTDCISLLISTRIRNNEHISRTFKQFQEFKTERTFPTVRQVCSQHAWQDITVTPYILFIRNTLEWYTTNSSYFAACLHTKRQERRPIHVFFPTTATESDALCTQTCLLHRCFPNFTLVHFAHVLV